MRLCSEPGCARAIPDADKYCSECRTGGVRVHTYTDRKRYAKQYASREWKIVSTRILRRDPVCKRCSLELSALVDHRVPAAIAVAQCVVSGFWPYNPFAGFFLMVNLQGLCRKCHGLKTEEDKGHTGPWPSVVETWLASKKNEREEKAAGE